MLRVEDETVLKATYIARSITDLVRLIRACFSPSLSQRFETFLLDVLRCLQTISISALGDKSDADGLLSFSETDDDLITSSAFNCSLCRRSLTAITVSLGSFSNRSCCASRLLFIILRLVFDIVGNSCVQLLSSSLFFNSNEMGSGAKR